MYGEPSSCRRPTRCFHLLFQGCEFSVSVCTETRNGKIFYFVPATKPIRSSILRTSRAGFLRNAVRWPHDWHKWIEVARKSRQKRARPLEIKGPKFTKIEAGVLLIRARSLLSYGREKYQPAPIFRFRQWDLTPLCSNLGKGIGSRVDDADLSSTHVLEGSRSATRPPQHWRRSSSLRSNSIWKNRARFITSLRCNWRRIARHDYLSALGDCRT